MKRLIPHIALGLMVAQLMLMLLSWLCSAAFPTSGIHSLLSGEGLRWFFGHFSQQLAKPWLADLLLLAIAYGCLVRSRIWPLGRSYRERRALWLSLAWLVVCVVAVLLLTVTPHAVLLSASGTLWPSPFSFSLIPVIAFSMMTFGWLYGTIAGHYQDFTEVYQSLLEGIRLAAPLLLFYVLLTQFYESLMFVLP
ncbi:MAG: AbgT family transporter [Prevotella sp.]|nr:AbgT family transporter [Prevotella sp.]MBO6191487.1 AbgT family transporter [Prevotella sp.]